MLYIFLFKASAVLAIGSLFCKGFFQNVSHNFSRIGILFRELFNELEAQGHGINRFANYLRSFIAMFVFVTSNENYSEFIYEGTHSYVLVLHILPYPR